MERSFLWHELAKYSAGDTSIFERASVMEADGRRFSARVAPHITFHMYISHAPCTYDLHSLLRLLGHAEQQQLIDSAEMLATGGDASLATDTPSVSGQKRAREEKGPHSKEDPEAAQSPDNKKAKREEGNQSDHGRLDAPEAREEVGTTAQPTDENATTTTTTPTCTQRTGAKPVIRVHLEVRDLDGRSRCRIPN
jgi:hypothetical protein